MRLSQAFPPRVGITPLVTEGFLIHYRTPGNMKMERDFGRVPLDYVTGHLLDEDDD